MKKLCLGSLLKVLCQVRAVEKQSYFIVALFSFLKDHDRYKDDNFQIHLKSGKYNFNEVDEMINYDKEALVKVITRKPILPSEEEVEVNPRSRSAKLRVAERI